MGGDNIIYYGAFKGIKAIPFLFELKLLIDWAVTNTSLDFFKWLKFENIYETLFTTHCVIKSQNYKKPGHKITTFEKIYIGVLGFIIILCLLIGPLLLFSDLNPTNTLNNITNAEIKVNIISLNIYIVQFNFDGKWYIQKHNFV